MSAQDRAIQKLARELAGIKKEVVSWRGPQADYTSIENGGNFTFKDGDGNVTAIVGGQDDGSNTIRHVDGPTPPIPSGLTAHVDGPIVQVSWDGTFEDADTATHDWSHLEVVVVGPSNEQLTATINDITGASTSVAATASGEWDVFARSVSRADKRSLDGDAGTVTVEVVGLSGAINDAIGSANGKNTVRYSEFAPSPADEGIAGDTWFVGSVADIKNPNNLAQNAEFNTLQYQRSDGMAAPSGGTTLELATSWFSSAPTSLKIVPTGSANTTAVDQIQREYAPTAADAGKTFTISADFHLDSPQTGSFWTHPRRILVRARYNGFTSSSWMYSDSAPNVAGTHRVKVTFTLPAGLEWWYFLLTNGSSTTPVYWDNLVIEEGATDGKFWVTNDDGSWNVVEQYRHNGVVWKPVELNHEVISSVDLGKATVGELDGIRIMGQSIRGQQLSGDAIDGKVVTGGTYRTTDGTGQWSDDGLFISQPDGTSLVRFPTDGSPLSLTASDVQIDRASITDLDLSYGAVRSGGSVTLASGVTPPASPPELTTGWQKVCTLDKPAMIAGAELTYDWLGLGYWSNPNGASWVRAVNVLGSEGDAFDVIECYDADTGAFEQAISIGLNPRSGVTVIGDVAYVVGPDYSKANIGKQWVHGYDLNTGARVVRWEMVRFGPTFERRLALGTDGTNIVVAGINTFRALYAVGFNPSTGAIGLDAKTPNESWTGGQDLEGVSVSGSEVTILPLQTARIYTVSGNTLTRKLDANNATGFAGWDNPNKNGAGLVDHTGLAWVSVVDGAGNVYRGYDATPTDTNAEVRFTWWDGTNETTPSPASTIVAPARNVITVSFPVRAGLQKRIYIRATSSGGWRRFNIAESTTALQVAPTGDGSNTLPTVNTFPNADPAVLRSTNGNIEFSGDGSGKIGPLTFGADGSMDGLPKIASGTLVITPSAANTPTRVAVTLPSGMFTTTPIITVTADTTVPGTTVTGVASVTLSPTAFEAVVTRTNTTDTRVNWIAVGT